MNRKCVHTIKISFYLTIFKSKFVFNGNLTSIDFRLFWNQKKYNCTDIFPLVLEKYGIFPNSRYADPPLSPSEEAIFTWEMRTVLNQVKNQFPGFSDHYFLSYGRFCTQNSSKIIQFLVLKRPYLKLLKM